MRNLFYFITFHCFLSCLQAVQPNLSSDLPIQFNQDDQSMIAEGNARLEGKGFLIESEKIRFVKNKGFIEAKENVKITRSGMRLTTDRAEYRFNDKQISADQFRFGFSPLYLSGQEFFASGDHVEGKRAVIYYNEPDGFEPNIQVKRLFFDRNAEKIRVEGAVFRAGKVPFFYLPNFEFKTGVTPYDPGLSLGYATHLGAFTKADLWFQSGEESSVGGFINSYTKRGLLIGPKFRYGKKSSLSERFGDWSLGHIHDWNDPGFDRSGDAIDKNRYYIKGFHKENFRDGFDFLTQLDWRSDKEFFRDFDYRFFENNQDSDTFIESNYLTENSVVSIFGRFRPNSFEPVIQRLPELTFSYLPTPLLETNFVQEAKLQFSYLKHPQESILGGNDDSKRVDSYYKLSRPLYFEDWFSFTPLIGSQITHYLETLDSSESYTRVVGEIGFDLEIKSYASWEVEEPVWAINGIRHILRPNIQYRALPGKENGSGRIREIDKGGIRLARVNPLGLGQNPSIDQIKKIHTTRFGLENTVQTRSQEYGSRTLLRLNLYQDLLFAKGIEENTFDSFYSDLELTPADWLQLDFLSRLKTEDLTLKNYSSALTLKDGDVRSIQFGTEILQNEIEEYFVRANVRINQNFGISTKITFDAEDEEWSELIGGLDTMLGRYWKIASSFGYQQNSERRGNWRLDMNLRLLSF